MKFKTFRMLASCFILLGIIAVMISPVLAQEPTKVYRGQLSADDCAILEQSQVAMQTIESASIDSTNSFTVGGFEMMPGMDTLTFSITANGAIGGDLAGLINLQTQASAMGAQVINPEALSEMMGNYGDIINSLQMTLVMQIAVPEMLASPGEPSSLQMEMRASDGIMYFYAEDPSQPTSGWMGLDISNFSEEYQKLLDEAFATGNSELTEEQMQLLYDTEYMKLMNDPEFVNQFTTITRLEDVNVDGATLAAFESTIDYGAMFSDERMRSAFQEYFQTIIALDDTGISEQEVVQVIDFLNLTIDYMTRDYQISSVQWIDLEGFFVRHVEVSMAMTIDIKSMLDAIADVTGEPMDSSEIPFETLTLDFSSMTDLGSFNEPVQVEIPENVEITDPFDETMSEF